MVGKQYKNMSTVALIHTSDEGGVDTPPPPSGGGIRRDRDLNRNCRRVYQSVNCLLP